jgi:integrase/recombinase XerD
MPKKPHSEPIAQEMRIYDQAGLRLYLNKSEREAFLQAANEEDREDRVFCHVLHYSGCRPSEALELSTQRILIHESALVFRSLKKRKYDNQGRKKKPHYRAVDVPEGVIDDIDLVFAIRQQQRAKKGKDLPLWSMSRPTA